MPNTLPPLVPATPGSLSLDHLEKTIGVYFIGYMFGMILYGFTFFQAYMYYSRYPKDHWAIKTFVATIVSVDTAVMSLQSQTLYYYLVILFPFTRGVEFATKPYCTQLELSFIAVFIAQLFYAYCIWANSRNTLMSGAIAILSTASFVLGSIMTGQLLDNTEFAHMGTNPNKAIAGTSHGFGAAAAILCFIGISMGPLPKGFKPFKSTFDYLVAYTVSYGGSAVVLQIAYTFVFVGAADKHYWIPFQVVATKLFVIGVLTYLDTRISLQQRAMRKEDWGSSGNSRTLNNQSGTTVGNGAQSAIEFNVKPIVISVDQSTQQDHEYSMKGRGYENS